MVRSFPIVISFSPLHLPNVGFLRKDGDVLFASWTKTSTLPCPLHTRDSAALVNKPRQGSLLPNSTIASNLPLHQTCMLGAHKTIPSHPSHLIPDLIQP